MCHFASGPDWAASSVPGGGGGGGGCMRNKQTLEIHSYTFKHSPVATGAKNNGGGGGLQTNLITRLMQQHMTECNC